MLVRAHKIREAIARGQECDHADVARRLGFTRAWLAHLLDLPLLAPDVQEPVLFLIKAVDGVEPLSERALRAVAHAASWDEQRTQWARVREAEVGDDSAILTPGVFP